MSDESRTVRAGWQREFLEAIEEERRKLGEELHDGACQTLVGTVLLVDSMRRAAAAGKPIPPQACTHLQDALEKAITQLRAISHRVRPIEMRGTGLLQALQELTAGKPNAEFTCEQAIFVEEAMPALALYRIAEEALENASKRPYAGRIQVTLKIQGGCLILELKENAARVLAENDANGSTGTPLMFPWVAALGGTIEVNSGPGVGMTVTCKVPCEVRRVQS